MTTGLKKFLSSLHEPIYAARLKVLVKLISPHLHQNDTVLDVGCGSGTLGHALLSANQALPGLKVTGLEKFKRGGEPIPVTLYEGKRFPLEDRSVDVVIVADVLHHEEEPSVLMQECVRVSRRLVIVKDHQIKGFLAYPRVCLMDWAANVPYGIPCLFRYNTPEQWEAFLKSANLEVTERLNFINLYPPMANLIFGRGLQCFYVSQVKNVSL
jgi:ubiquinone/menaquinone biosynthesis C-methylase UbiE